MAEIQSQVETEVLKRERPALPQGGPVIGLTVGPEDSILQVLRVLSVSLHEISW
jgi:hypothetical protein